MRLLQTAALCLLGGLYWQVICQVTGVREPWDAGNYWTLWYPVSLALSGVAGWLCRGHSWSAGALLTFAQLPIMWINNGTGPLWVVGVLYLCVLAVPAITISALTGWFADRARSRSDIKRQF